MDHEPEFLYHPLGQIAHSPPEHQMIQNDVKACINWCFNDCLSHLAHAIRKPHRTKAIRDILHNSNPITRLQLWHPHHYESSDKHRKNCQCRRNCSNGRDVTDTIPHSFTTYFGDIAMRILNLEKIIIHVSRYIFKLRLISHNKPLRTQYILKNINMANVLE